MTKTDPNTADGLGFVQHEQFGDGIVAFTVFHQLHCLVSCLVTSSPTQS